MKERNNFVYLAVAGLGALVFGIYKYSTWLPPHQSKEHMREMTEKSRIAREKAKAEKEKETTEENGN